LPHINLEPLLNGFHRHIDPMMSLTPEDIADLRRWLLASVVVVFAYGGVAAAVVRWHDHVEPAEPAGAIIVEFAPEQVAAPEQVQSDAVPERPIEKVEKEQEEIVEPKGEEQIKEKVEPKPIEEQPREAVPITTPPPPEPPKVAMLPAGPVQGPPAPVIDPKAMQTWIGEISAAIERKKRHLAAVLRTQGTAQVSFTIDQNGNVTESRIVKSSGAADLDEEALALVRRAAPFPPSPAQSAGNEPVQHLTVPIRFSLQ
jgi:periplasmic protein TonB